MPHISPEPLKKSYLEQLYQQIINQIRHTKNSKELNSYLSSLLTETEQIMLAKRLAVILMLEKNWSPFYISKSLKISRPTVSRIAKQKDQGVHDGIIKVAHKIKYQKKLWETIEEIMRAGLPPRGKGRWRRIYK